jgi:hypothetical protein
VKFFLHVVPGIAHQYSLLAGFLSERSLEKMAPVDSDSDAELGPGASDGPSYVACPRSGYAALQLQPVQAPLGTYRTSDEGLHGRLVSYNYSFSASPDNEPRGLRRRDSDAMSTAVTMHSSRASTWGSSNAGTDLLSLYTGSSAGSVSSIRTADVDSHGPQQEWVEGDDSVLRSWTEPFSCPYEALGCPFTTDELGGLEEHCKAHFRGKLPRETDCPLGCGWKSTAKNGVDAWNDREAHLGVPHWPFNKVMTLAGTHKHFEHMWRIGILSAAQLKELRQSGHLSSQAAPYLESERTARRRGR